MAQRASFLYRKAIQVDSHIDKVIASLGVVASSKRLDPDELLIRRIVSAFLIALLVSYSVYPLFVRANTLILHPEACLGGWYNTAYASRAPNANGYYNESNSAVLDKNVQAEVYCGPFAGEKEEGTIPLQASLALYWSSVRAVEEPAVTGTTTIEIVSESFASSTQDILDADASSTVSFTATTTTEAPAQEERVEETVPTESIQEEVAGAPTEEASQENQPENQAPVSSETPSTPSASEEANPPAVEPVSVLETLLFAFVPRAHAQEGGSRDITPAVLTETQSDIPVTQNAEVSVSNESSAETSPAHEMDQQEISVPETSQEVVLGTSTENDKLPEAGETASTSDAINTPESTPESAKESGGFLEVLYSLDGTTWIRVASVAPADIRENAYDLSLTQISWEKIDALQIKIQSLSSFDDTPSVYLDAVELRINYEKEKKSAEPVDEKTQQTQGIIDVKGLGPHVVFLREKEGEIETLYLYNLNDKNKERLPIDQPVSERFPVGFKGGRMFLLTQDEKTLLTYDFSTKDYVKVFVPHFDVSMGERAEVFMEGFPWKIIIGSNNFFFYSEETGEVFSDEDSGFVSAVESSPEEDSVLRRETLEFLNIFNKEEIMEE